MLNETATPEQRFLIALAQDESLAGEVRPHAATGNLAGIYRVAQAHGYAVTDAGMDRLLAQLVAAAAAQAPAQTQVEAEAGARAAAGAGSGSGAGAGASANIDGEGHLPDAAFDAAVGGFSAMEHALGTALFARVAIDATRVRAAAAGSGPGRSSLFGAKLALLDQITEHWDLTG